MGVERWRGVLLDPENEAWVVETGEPAGFICLTPPPDYVPQARSFLDQIYLLPSWQSGGMGSGIWRHLMEDLRRRRALPLALAAVEVNDRARIFYEGHGGHAIDLILGFTWQGRPFYEIVYLFDST
tara:strand:+ start:47 stop:424 length:378 start_codon:yes stop_codon:yes gene_type:complete